jgi:HSP20 family protein
MAALLPRRSSGQNLPLMDPTCEFGDIHSRMGQLLNLALGRWAWALAVRALAPAADVSETDDAYQVHVELPGVGKDQTNVQLQERELLITGEIPEQENGHWRRDSRRAPGARIPHAPADDINPEQVSAGLKDGVLTVTVPKTETAKPRRVEMSC